MDSLAAWLEAHQEQLVTSAIQQLSSRETLRQQAQGPVRWFFDSLIKAIAQEQQSRLESLLRNWVAMCSVPINGEPVGILPVLGVFKQSIWQEFLADPPDTALELAIRLDKVIMDAAEFLSKLEAAALFDEISHQLVTQRQPDHDPVESSKESFVSVAAHELKTPLTVIEGYTNMLQLEFPEAANPRAALMVQGIQSGVTRMRELVEDMIDVSLIEIGLLSVDLQPVWLRRLLDIVEFELSDVIKHRHLVLTIARDTIPSQPTVGDPERLLKAIQKVLANAVKYTPDGGKITISAHSLSEFVDITIADTGIGIAPDNLERIFEKFSVIGDISRHSSSKVNFKGGGPGLGLVIAKGIIEAHGGTIWAESAGFDENKCPGSRFHIMLPMRDVRTGEGMEPLIATAAGTLAESLSSAKTDPVAKRFMAQNKTQDEQPGESTPQIATETTASSSPNGHSQNMNAEGADEPSRSRENRP